MIFCQLCPLVILNVELVVFVLQYKLGSAPDIEQTLGARTLR